MTTRLPDGLPPDGLFPVLVRQHYGYADAAGNLRIAPTWDVAGPFREGLACVGTDGAAPAGGGRWGYIEPDGGLAIAPRFARAGDFSEGRAAVNEGGRYHYLDRDDSWCFEGGAFGYIDRKGRVKGGLRWLGAEPFSDGVGAVYGSGQSYFVAADGEPLEWGPFTGTAPFSEGLAACARRVETGGTPRRGGWGWIDSRGHWAIEPRFEGAGVFSEGLAAAMDATTFRYVFVDRTGEVAVKPCEPCMAALPFRHGLAAAMREPRRRQRGHGGDPCTWGFLDREGHWAIAPEFEYAERFQHGIALVQAGGRYGFIDTRGTWVVAPELTWARGCVDGVALGVRDGRGHAYRVDGSVLWRE